MRLRKLINTRLKSLLDKWVFKEEEHRQIMTKLDPVADGRHLSDREQHLVHYGIMQGYMKCIMDLEKEIR